MIFLVVLLAGSIAIDRWLKWLALSGQVYTFGSTHFFLVKNDALVFSWPAPNWLAILLMFLAISIVSFFAYRAWKHTRLPMLIAWTTILLGALSNLYDRLAFGYVVDWAYLGRWWPVFNVADVMIASGMISLFWFSRRLTKIA